MWFVRRCYVEEEEEERHKKGVYISTRAREGKLQCRIVSVSVDVLINISND